MNEHELLLYQSLKGLHLLEKAPKAQVASDLLGLQAQFSNNPKLSLRLRASDYAPESWDDGLVKIWSHRGTMHVIPESELGLHLSAADQHGAFVDGAWGISASDAELWAGRIEEMLRSGICSRDGLKAACAAEGMSEELSGRVFYGWGGLIREMVMRGRLVCKTGTKKEYALPRSVTFLPRDDARLCLLEHYFEHFGPATLTDCRSFFGNWRKADLDPLLERLLPTLWKTVLDGQTYYHKHALIDGVLPECVLIPGFDQLILGYRRRERFIDAEHLPKLVNGSGIIFPAILLRGRIRARWKLNGERVEVTAFEPLFKKDEAAVRRTVRRLLGK